MIEESQLLSELFSKPSSSEILDQRSNILHSLEEEIVLLMTGDKLVAKEQCE